jgi:transposase
VTIEPEFSLDQPRQINPLGAERSFGEAQGREGLMGEFPRKSDGRRVFTVEFKRGVVQQLLKGDKTLAEVSRELDIQPSVVRQWKRRFEAGATAAVATNEDVVPVSALREAHQRIRELERLLGKKQMEIEILQAAQEVVKKSPWLRKGSGR